MSDPVPAPSIQPRGRGNRRPHHPRPRRDHTNTADATPTTGRGQSEQNHYQRRIDGRSRPVQEQRQQDHSSVEGLPRTTPVSRGRARGRGRGSTSWTGGVQGRQFGGHLTSQNPPTTVGHTPARFPKSTAPDIATRIQEDIEHGVYECPICTSEILRGSKIWSCHTCWTVFHLSCIKKWAGNDQKENETQGDAKPWRCPGCNLPKETQPKAYSCWCEKELEPRTITGLPPHSCGQTCGRERRLPQQCPHRCELICHAGPCPPCGRMGPTQSCYCGKATSSRRCIDTDYNNGWSCNELCGDVMPCGEHLCQRKCHEGLCGACEILIDARCYCGKIEISIPCCERGDEKTSKRSYTGENDRRITEEWNGLFDCENVCDRQFDCSKHYCEKSCHPQTADVEHCPRSPDVVTRCPCGKTDLAELLSRPRQTCEDDIPHCTKPCGKQLSCGHSCGQPCHEGQCMPCRQQITISCRCGRTTSSSLCHQGTVEQPQCMRICTTTLNCGRHSCDEHCCTGERKAAERQNTKRNYRRLHIAPLPSSTPESEFEPEHICTRICGRTLKCANHTCENLCHKGPCPPCLEAIFDEISCACGRTVLQPPLPCGTEPPACRFQCERPKSCGHAQVPHTCHQDGEACPKCPFLTTKICLCRKKTLNNQQCWLTSVRCGEICGKKLKCGSHNCRKSCHAPGECEDAHTESRTCQQACGKSKNACGHPCEEKCHAPFSCREEKPCSHKIFITCPCQTHKVEARCNASRHDPEGNGKRELKCDDECARLERNRKLALALNIDQSTHTDDHIPYSEDSLNMYQELGAQWAQHQEREFRVFAEANEEKRLRFKPMPSTQRAFLHSLAEDFGLDSESMDPEPHRHVALYKTPRFVSAPNKTIGESLRIRTKQRSAVGTMTVTNEELPKKETRSNLLGDPYNGFLLTHPRFGLTIEELHAVIKPATSDGSMPHLDISFLLSGDVVFKARLAGVPQGRTIAAEREGEAVLKRAKPVLGAAISSKGFGSLELCRTDESLNVTRKESEEKAAGGGWSQVAARGAPRKEVKPTTPFAGRNGFGVLGQGNTVVLGKKKPKAKKEMVDVVDDWEKAMSDEETEKGAEKVARNEEGEAVDARSPT